MILRFRERSARQVSKLTLLFLVCWFLASVTTPVFAAEKPVVIVLFKGKVYLWDKQKERRSATVGQEFTISQYPRVQIEKAATLYLQRGNKLVEIKKEGIYELFELFIRQPPASGRSLSFLSNLIAPRSYISQLRVRGETEGTGLGDQQIFDDLWQQLVLEKSQEPSQFSNKELLGMAAWYQQQGNAARVAYLMERVNASSHASNYVYREMRMDALQKVTLSDINKELEETRARAVKKYRLGSHKAILIGINSYDEPSWQALKTPINDVEELKNVLVRDYFFKDSDVVVLRNATFDNIIGAFNDIKRVTDSDTNLLIYYAGHGYYPPGEDEGYWVPRDAGSPETQRLFIPTSTILSKIKAIQSRHTLVIADSCFSGSLIRTTRGVAVHSRYFRDLSSKKSRQIITSGGLEPVADQGWGNNSVFAGKLLDILKQKRTAPLSASELALNLRKEVKNADALQTPEYGRLHMADDESGEFFFVRKDQELTAAMDQSVPVSAGQDQDLPEQAVDVEEEIILYDRDGYRLNIGFGFHMAILNYKFSYEDSGNAQKSEKDSTSLSGTMLHVGFKNTKEQLNYEVAANFGQLSTSSFECDSEDEETEFCKKYAESSVSGRYNSLGIFASYNILPNYPLDLEAGGGFLYQNYSFKKLLDAENVDSTFISTCARVEISYLFGDWYLGERNEFCVRTYQIDGTLSDFESSSLSDLQIPFNFKINLVAGYKF
ncbi:MAG: caspase family protein [Proteobacteria bacterium]|nr:caspase family protein [Pseudomonadota bacterium]